MNASPTAPGSSRWLLRRNCSLRPGQLAALLGALAVVSLLVALICTLSGAWYVMVFALVETLGLALAFVIYARHAGDYERIELSGTGLCVETLLGGRLQRTTLPGPWAQVRLPVPGRGTQALIRLGPEADAVLVGRFASPAARQRIAREIRQALARA